MTGCLWLAASVGLSGAWLRAQSPVPSQPAGAAQKAPDAKPAGEDNPFPGEGAGAQKPAAGGQAQKPGTAPAATPAGAKPAGGDNPFPGEDTSAPIIPVGPEPGTGRRNADAGAGRAADADGDPVRSPDGPGDGGPGNGAADDGFSSSRSGVGSAPDENEDDARPGKAAKAKTPAQRIKEDVDVGGFYAEKKNWKASQERFAAAFALDRENEDAVLGLAEAERHLNLWDKAREHYELFLSYDPDGPHSKAAKKALEQVELAQSRGVTAGAGSVGTGKGSGAGAADFQPK